MIELYELRQFAAFAECGTLSEAAEKLHLSQPALSRNMKKLEEDLGVPLFVRRKNKLELNENGQYVLTLAKELLSDAQEFTKKVQSFDRRTARSLWGYVRPPLAGSSRRCWAVCTRRKRFRQRSWRKASFCPAWKTGPIN